MFVSSLFQAFEGFRFVEGCECILYESEDDSWQPIFFSDKMLSIGPPCFNEYGGRRWRYRRDGFGFLVKAALKDAHILNSKELDSRK